MTDSEKDYYFNIARQKPGIWRWVMGFCENPFMSDAEKREYIEKYFQIKPQHEEGKHQN